MPTWIPNRRPRRQARANPALRAYASDLETQYDLLRSFYSGVSTSGVREVRDADLALTRADLALIYSRIEGRDQMEHRSYLLN